MTILLIIIFLVALTLPSKNYTSPFTFYFLKKSICILIIIKTGVLNYNTLYIQSIGLGGDNNIISILVILSIISILNSLGFLNIKIYFNQGADPLHHNIKDTFGFLNKIYFIGFLNSIYLLNIINLSLGFLLKNPYFKTFTSWMIKIICYNILRYLTGYLIGFPYINLFTSQDFIKILQFTLTIIRFLLETILRLTLIIFKLFILLLKKSSLFISYYLDKDKVQVLSTEYSKTNINKYPRLMVFTCKIEPSRPLVKSLQYIFNELQNTEEFINFGKYKIIITQVLTSSGPLTLHRNVLIKNDTTFEEFYSKIKYDLVKFKDHDYHNLNEIMSVFRVLVWNVDLYENINIKRTLSTINISQPNPLTIGNGKRSYSTYNGSKGFNLKINSYINPIPLPKENNIKIQHPYDKLKPIATLDIETITFKGLQLPIYISLTYNNTNDFYFNETTNFMINKTNFDTDPDKAVIDMFKELFKFIEVNLKPQTTIFVHNLGAFDGYFIFKYASIIYDINSVKSIIDAQNRFILISIKHIVFKD